MIIRSAPPTRIAHAHMAASISVWYFSLECKAKDILFHNNKCQVHVVNVVDCTQKNFPNNCHGFSLMGYKPHYLFQLKN